MSIHSKESDWEDLSEDSKETVSASRYVRSLSQQVRRRAKEAADELRRLGLIDPET